MPPLKLKEARWWEGGDTPWLRLPEPLTWDLSCNRCFPWRQRVLTPSPQALSEGSICALAAQGTSRALGLLSPASALRATLQPGWEEQAHKRELTKLAPFPLAASALGMRGPALPGAGSPWLGASSAAL